MTDGFQMDLTFLIPGVALSGITIYFAMTWRKQAEWVRGWYASMSKEDGRPWWRRGHFRPNHRQSIFVAWFYITAFAIIAVYLVVVGLGAT